MVNFQSSVETIRANMTKTELKKMDDIAPYDQLRLSSLGDNDSEGFQVFTPEFIVKGMCQAVGKDILDFGKNILEPTSGDGAFTTRILRERLKTIKGDFEMQSLKALSTIYSIEVDKNLISRQRNNIMTVMVKFIEENNIIVDGSYYDMVRCIVFKNFIWGMFNSNNSFGGGLAGVDVVYAMPQAIKGNLKSLDFPVWEFHDTSIVLRMEGVDLW